MLFATLPKPNPQKSSSAYHQKFIIGTINAQKGKSIKNPEVGPNGILDNHGYGVLDVREFPKDDNLKLVKIRNPWGPDGCWNGPFSDDSEDWDKYRHLRDVIKLEFKSKKSDGTWWMSFGSFCDYLNKIYICRVYPDSWQNYSLELKWKNKTAGGRKIMGALRLFYCLEEGYSVLLSFSNNIHHLLMASSSLYKFITTYTSFSLEYYP